MAPESSVRLLTRIRRSLRYAPSPRLAVNNSSRRELEEMMGCRVHLKLFVKVKEDWPERAEYLQLMGLQAPV